MAFAVVKPEVIKVSRTVKPHTSGMFPDKEKWGFSLPSVLLENEIIREDEISLVIQSFKEVPGVNIYMDALLMFCETQDQIIEEIFVMIEYNGTINDKKVRQFGAFMPGASKEDIYEAMQKFIIYAEDELGYNFD